MQRSSTTGRFRLRRKAMVRDGALTAALLTLCISALTARAQPAKPTEYDVKAAYLIDFGKFIRSQEQQPRVSFDICVLGRDSFGQSLEALASNESINNLPVRIRHTDPSEAKTCSIVFISSMEEANIREDLAVLGKTDVLTVSDAPDFLKRGGMIQFVLAANHVRFAVNLGACNRAHLVVSSELLRVASSVTGRPPGEGQP